MKSPLMDRAILKIAESRHLERFAIRALLKANELLGLAIGVRLAKLRDSDDRFAALFAESEAHVLPGNLHVEIAEIVVSRWDRLPERRRPHYRASERYRILRIRHLLSLSLEETARRFRISHDTVARWERQLEHEPGDTIGSLVRPEPPVRRYADVVRHVVKSMALTGFGGYETIAQTLARAGWKLSKRTVGRILKEQPPTPAVAPEVVTAMARAVRARHPNHIWMSDITEIRSLFGLFTFHLAVVLDVFSRMPLTARVFRARPSAAQVVVIIEHAVGRFGPPRHFVSDQGSQFISDEFQRLMQRHNILHRYGAIGQSGSIAIIERLWRTLKARLRLRVLRPLSAQELEHRLALGLVYYARFRPHQGLGGATPVELYFGWTPAHVEATHPPRARHGEGPTRCPFSIAFLDINEQRLPYLLRRAA